jgi:hypothetical protein
MKRLKEFAKLLLAMIVVSFVVTTFCIYFSRDYKIYQLDNGTILQCKFAQMENCGMYLSSCSDNNVYTCQTNVKELYND